MDWKERKVYPCGEAACIINPNKLMLRAAQGDEHAQALLDAAHVDAAVDASAAKDIIADRAMRGEALSRTVHAAEHAKQLADHARGYARSLAVRDPQAHQAVASLAAAVEALADQLTGAATTAAAGHALAGEAMNRVGKVVSIVDVLAQK